MTKNNYIFINQLYSAATYLFVDLHYIVGAIFYCIALIYI